MHVLFYHLSAALDENIFFSFAHLTDVFPGASGIENFARISRRRTAIKFGIEISPRNIEDNQISLNARQ